MTRSTNQSFISNLASHFRGNISGGGADEESTLWDNYDSDNFSDVEMDIGGGGRKPKPCTEKDRKRIKIQPIKVPAEHMRCVSAKPKKVKAAKPASGSSGKKAKKVSGKSGKSGKKAKKVSAPAKKSTGTSGSSGKKSLPAKKAPAKKAKKAPAKKAASPSGAPAPRRSGRVRA